MKCFLWLIVAVTLTGACGCVHSRHPKGEPLGGIADKALTEGNEAKLNVWFARFLGLEAKQPLLLKRLHFEKEGATNTLNVLRRDRNTIILSERRQQLGTFYLTDRSGNLKRAVVNDGTIAEGGITNLSLGSALAGFERQKQLWLKQESH